MIRTKRRHRFLFILLPLLVCFTLFIIHSRKASKKIAASSHMVSIGAYLDSLDTSKFKTRFCEEWTLLNELDYTWLGPALSEYGWVDNAGLSQDPDKILLDYWRQRILIAGCKINENKIDFIVWSKGPDRISGTLDDITSPYKVKIPKNLKQKNEIF